MISIPSDEEKEEEKEIHFQSISYKISLDPFNPIPFHLNIRKNPNDGQEK